MLAQGFNKRYDAFSWGFPQGGFNIEFNREGYTAIAVSEDCDSTGPNSCFFHASVHLDFLDLQGNRISEKRAWRSLHSSTAGWANCCDTVLGGGYVTGGSSEDTTGFDEVHLIRFDANGDTLWTRVFGDPAGNRYWVGYQVKAIAQNGFILVGSTDQGGSADGFALLTDATGNEVWRRRYGGASPQADGFLSVALGEGDSFFLGGSTYPTDNNGDPWVIHVDGNGEPIWETSWGGPYDDGAGHLTTLLDGNILVANAHGFNEQGTRFKPALTKLDAEDGSILWDRTYGPEVLNTVLFAAKEAANNDLIACGVTYAGPGEHQRGLLLHTTSEGDSLWMRSYYYQDSLVSTGQGRFDDVLPTDDGGFIAAGATYFPAVEPNPPGYSQDTWVVKVDGDGCIVPGCDGVGVSEVATNLLGALSIFPNPAQGNTSIRLALPGSVANAGLQLSISAADGKLVRQESIAGNGEHTLALEGLAAGVYHVHISTASKWLTGGKLVVE